MAKGGKNGHFRGWIEEQGLENVCKWEKLGLRDEQIAKNMGIGRTSLYLWQKKFLEFAKAIKDAKRVPELEIENAMFELACGRVFVEEIKSVLDPKTSTILKIEKTRRQIPPRPVMLIFVAKNRMRDHYKDYAPVPAESNDDNGIRMLKFTFPITDVMKNDSLTAKIAARKISCDQSRHCDLRRCSGRRLKLMLFC